MIDILMPFACLNSNIMNYTRLFKMFLNSVLICFDDRNTAVLIIIYFFLIDIMPKKDHNLGGIFLFCPCVHSLMQSLAALSITCMFFSTPLTHTTPPLVLPHSEKRIDGIHFLRH